MGLDISTKKEYARFNWAGARGFMEWSERKLKMNPFPNWDGGNGTTVVFGREPQDEREIKGDPKLAEKWVGAFERYVKKIEDNILEMGQGQRIGEVAYRTYDLCFYELKEKYKFADRDEMLGYRKELKEWEYIQAVKWYFVLKDAIDCGFINYF